MAKAAPAPKRQRVRLEDEAKQANHYLVQLEGKEVEFFSSGCAILDCILSGGWASGRVINVVGDKSTAKTGLATEALINFKVKYPKGFAKYQECEGAYDFQYAKAMGLPLDDIDFGEEPLLTVEAFAEDLERFTDQCEQAGQPGLYVLDSLDSLSDKAEGKRKVGDASFGMAKPKLLSEMFRKLCKRMEAAKVTLLVISQVRDNINASFGEKHTRSGGKALDFYASQVVWLARIKNLKRTIQHVERVYGSRIKANCKKNKVGIPFRTCEFDFIFGFGVDDLNASLDWLDEVRRMDALGLKGADLKEYLGAVALLKTDEYAQERAALAKVVFTEWVRIEKTFLPTRTKY